MTRSRSEAPAVRGGAALAVPAAALLVFLACHYVVGPRIAAHGGYGFDGRIYSAFAQDFFAYLEQGRVLDHYANRFLPSLVIFAVTRTLGLSLTTSADVFTAFYVYNGVLLLLGLYLWRRISVALAFEPWLYWLGVCGLIVNTQTLKMTPYYPMLTDTTAWCLGLASVHAYLKGRRLVLLLCMVLAYFTWPIACGFIWVLLAFPSRVEEVVPVARPARRLAMAAGLVAAAGAYAYVAVYDGQLGDPVFLISAAIALVYLGYVSRSIVVPESLISVKSLSVKMMAVALVLLGALTIVRHGIVAAYDLKPMQFSMESYVAACLRRSGAKPGAFLLSHVSYFGPAFILLLAYLRRTLEITARQGAGLCYSLVAMLGFALDSESRHLAFSYPLVVLAVCLLVREMSGRERLLGAFLAASVVGTKLYLPLNIPEAEFKPYEAFPGQWLFMNYGPWLSWKGYALTLAITAAMTLIVAAGLRRLRARA